MKTELNKHYFNRERIPMVLLIRISHVRLYCHGVIILIQFKQYYNYYIIVRPNGSGFLIIRMTLQIEEVGYFRNRWNSVWRSLKFKELNNHKGPPMSSSLCTHCHFFSTLNYYVQIRDGGATMADTTVLFELLIVESCLRGFI